MKLQRNRKKNLNWGQLINLKRALPRPDTDITTLFSLHEKLDKIRLKLFDLT